MWCAFVVRFAIGESLHNLMSVTSKVHGNGRGRVLF